MKRKLIKGYICPPSQCKTNKQRKSEIKEDDVPLSHTLSSNLTPIRYILVKTLIVPYRKE